MNCTGSLSFGLYLSRQTSACMTGVNSLSSPIPMPTSRSNLSTSSGLVYETLYKIRLALLSLPLFFRYVSNVLYSLLRPPTINSVETHQEMPSRRAAILLGNLKLHLVTFRQRLTTQIFPMLQVFSDEVVYASDVSYRNLYTSRYLRMHQYHVIVFFCTPRIV